jgi:hypothetical protein
MPRVELRRPRPSDCETLALRLRASDALEVKRSSGLEPFEVLVESSRASAGRNGTLLFDGEIAAMYGLVKPDILGDIAVPWLLTSDVVERHPGTFFRIAKTVVDAWAEKNPVLVQMVDNEYEGAKRFLEALDFRIYPPQAHGPFGAPFCPAVRKSNV